MVWGVDPLWEKYPGMSPYNYCAENPVKLVDLDGCVVSFGKQISGTHNVINCILNQPPSGNWLTIENKIKRS